MSDCTVYLAGTTDSVFIEALVHFILNTTWGPEGRLDLSHLILIIKNIRIT